MAYKIQIRNGTASEWSSANPVLAQGEMGAETDTGKFKIGNGTTAWNSMNYGTTATALYTATIPNTSWTGSSAPFSKAVTVTGIVSTDTPMIDLVLSGTYATDQTMTEDWAKIYRAVTSANTVTFYATSVPSASINVQLKVVR